MRDEIITKKDTLGFLIKIVLFFFKGKILIKSPRTQATKKQVKMKEGKKRTATSFKCWGWKDGTTETNQVTCGR